MNYTDTSTVEFKHIYTDKTKAAVKREGEELIRTALETVQANTTLPGSSINFSLEDDGSSITVRASGAPKWTAMFAQIFKSVKEAGVKEWQQINKKVKLFSSVGSRYTNANVSESHAESVDPTHQPTRVGAYTQVASNRGVNLAALAAGHSLRKAASKNVLHDLAYDPSIASAFAVFQRNIADPVRAIEAARAVYNGPEPELLPQRLVELYVEDELVTAILDNRTAPQQKSPDALILEAANIYRRIATPIIRGLTDEIIIESVERLYLKWQNIKPKRGGRRKTIKKRRHH